jgi:acetyl-CoA C-acetyltransferase
MRKVAIVGVGQVPVREHWESGLRELASMAVLNAMEDANVLNTDALFVGNMLGSYFSDQSNLGVLIAEHAALDVNEAITIEAACGSGAAAFRQAVLAVASGSVETAIAVGVEKLTEHSDVSPANGLATAADADYEAAMGLSFVAINALLMRRYMHEYKCSKSDFSGFVINAHKNSVHNKNAMFRNLINAEMYATAKLIADPINLLDSSPISDGAAAVVVTAIDNLSKFRTKPILVAACEVGIDTIALSRRSDPLRLKAVEKSTARAFQVAGVKHEDIDIFENHDAFSIMTTLALEAAGFSEWGKAISMAKESVIGINGRLPLSTFGGLKSRGHPVGATGIYQIVEAALQLRGEAPDSIQVPDAHRALVQNIGGSASFVVTSILEQMKF